MKFQFLAIFIPTDRSKPDRLYCDSEGRTLLWPESAVEPARIVQMLMANALPAKVICVTLEPAKT